MAERANNPPPNRNNRPSRGMIAAHVEKLRAMAAQLLREARRLSGDGPEDTVSGWSAERAATASFGRIRASPTAWALFERGFAEGRRSTRANTPQPEAARPRAGPPGRVPPRRTAPAYQRHDVRDGRGRFRRPAVQPQADQTDERPMVQPQAQQPVVPPPTEPPAEQQLAQQPDTPEQQLAAVERWVQAMEVTPGDPVILPVD
ncbi:uncharacterized protein LOC132950958 [Metopolophium dirhodum]|uniref:uncharacterized protein LOC132950958 n=1 Tax=Metopolophium dirhodum TaxID=44670 RepID=UPI00298F65A5|nr:uncharacterized protein LOC132950958 [Metopolophium dirhodum]